MTITEAAAMTSRCPQPLLEGIRGVIHRHLDWRRTSVLVADCLRESLPGPEILTEPERQGCPDCYTTHLLHSEPDGCFSVVGVVWRPGQETVIHDHVSWCVVGVLQGEEYEQIYQVTDDGSALTEVGRGVNHTGEVVGFAPPGDIHRVRNDSGQIAISLHVYGADIGRLGSSVRREYHLPVIG